MLHCKPIIIVSYTPPNKEFQPQGLVLPMGLAGPHDHGYLRGSVVNGSIDVGPYGRSFTFPFLKSACCFAENGRLRVSQLLNC